MKQKTIVIVGAGKGLGNHIGEAFGKNAFKVILMSRNEEALREYVRDFANKGIQADYRVADCSDNASVRSAISGVLDKYGSVDVLVYNAAVLKDGMPSEMVPEELVRRYQVDVAGAMCAAQQVIPIMKEMGNGTLLFTGGGLGLDPLPDFTSISVHKAALRALAIAFNRELASCGIYAGIVNIKGNIGSDEYYSPANIAKLFYRLYTRRDKVEITY